MAIFPSMARREQLIEEVAEPGFEHLDLGLGHGHVLGPVVGHGPRGRVGRHLSTRATYARMCIVVHIDWLVARAVVDSGSACARHARTVARDFGQKNGRCARGATPRPARRSQRKPYELRGKRVTSATRCVNWRWLNGLDESAGCSVISHLAAFYLAIARSAVCASPVPHNYSLSCDLTRIRRSAQAAVSVQTHCSRYVDSLAGRACVHVRQMDRNQDAGAASAVPVVC